MLDPRLFILLTAVIFLPLNAHATRTVTSPYVDEGTLKLKLKGGVTHDDERAARDGAVAAKLGMEYGFKGFSLELEGDIENAGDDNNTNYNATSLKLKTQLTEKGAYWLDVGARLAYEENHTAGPESMELKIILAKDTEKFRHIANFIFDREVGNGAVNDMNGGFSWGSRYKCSKAFQPGFEMYNNFGSLSNRPDFQDQDHSIGPAVYGGFGEGWKYEAAYLAGLTDNAADDRFKFVIEYSVPF
ncbi:MAG: hypothetical protein GC136_10425 [Alphaproteobacteria bacterium]|nr:hypothetical protein [Alphaproteobacteria bacterium]